MSNSCSNRPVIARCTQSVGVPLMTYQVSSSTRCTRSGTSSVSEWLAPLQLRSGATTVSGATPVIASFRKRRPSAR